MTTETSSTSFPQRRVSKLSLSYRPDTNDGTISVSNKTKNDSILRKEISGSATSEKSNSAESVPQVEISPATSAYTRHFRWIVRSVSEERKELQRLLLPDELRIASKVLQLSPVATLIYARLFSRTSNVFFAEELLGERFRSSSLLSVTDLEQGVQELHAGGMVIFPLDGQPSNQECLQISRKLLIISFTNNL